ncbi:unnamed protein product [Brassica rapa]|uniref:Uncharacterized protein n=2 Tax=Brassica TaxID=3705 RepID=A0A8D9CY63_BRACM|nr:unnamed protein product [Brassica napus]CAG7865776.1 unnamed protein product [Brassica rapa]CAG7901746.1 unnamed protein product [Brassica rapa]
MMIFQIWKSLMRLTMWWKMIRCVSFVHCQLILWLMNLMMITFSELVQMITLNVSIMS